MASQSVAAHFYVINLPTSVPGSGVGEQISIGSDRSSFGNDSAISPANRVEEPEKLALNLQFETFFLEGFDLKFKKYSIILL